MDPLRSLVCRADHCSGLASAVQSAVGVWHWHCNECNKEWSEHDEPHEQKLIRLVDEVCNLADPLFGKDESFENLSSLMVRCSQELSSSHWTTATLATALINKTHSASQTMQPVPEQQAFHQIARIALHWYEAHMDGSLLCTKVGLLTSMLYSHYGLAEEGQRLMAKHSPTLELLLKVPELAAAFQAGVQSHKAAV